MRKYLDQIERFSIFDWAPMAEWSTAALEEPDEVV